MISLMLYGYLTYKDKDASMLLMVTVIELACTSAVLCAWLSH